MASSESILRELAMLKVVATILVGAIPAAAATYYVGFVGSLASDANVPTIVARPAALTDSASKDSTGSESLDAFQLAAAISDPRTLETRLVRAFAEPYSLARNTEIAALFKRLAALDLGRALNVADTPGFDVRLLADVVCALAQDDVEAALNMLASIRGATMRLEVAIALLGVMGADMQVVERIAGALPENQQIEFHSEALAQFAERDPSGALNVALALSDAGIRSAAVQEVGISWVERDPASAVSNVNSLPLELRAAYRKGVTREWARIDVNGFLAYADAQPRLDDFLPAMLYAMSVAPELTFEVASRHPAVPIGGGYTDNVTIERTAFASMVSIDPARMLGVLRAMPEGGRKQELYRAFAETYGRQRPQEALTWAQSIEPPNPALVASVISHSATTDFNQALRWLSEYEARPSGQSFASPEYIAYTIGTIAGTDPRRAEMATWLLAHEDDPGAAAVLSRLTGVWMLSDPASAFDWMVSSDAARDPVLIAATARALAERDARSAAAYADRLPMQTRNIWLQEVLPRYGRQDPEGASNWIFQLSGDPGYESMFSQVVQQAAMTNPETAAGLLQAASDDLQQAVAPAVASAWAARDLRKAAQWAVTIANAGARNAATAQVASSWAYRDPEAAQSWVVDLPRGEVRDQAISSILDRLVRDGFAPSINWQLLNAFDSNEARERVLRSLIPSLARGEPELARSLFDRWIAVQPE